MSSSAAPQVARAAEKKARPDTVRADGRADSEVSVQFVKPIRTIDGWSGVRRYLLSSPKIHKGYTDRLAGRPFEADHRDDLDQYDYEQGRILAYELLAAGDAPAWPSPRRIPAALKRRVCERLGFVS